MILLNSLKNMIYGNEYWFLIASQNLIAPDRNQCWVSDGLHRIYINKFWQIKWSIICKDVSIFRHWSWSSLYSGLNGTSCHTKSTCAFNTCSLPSNSENDPHPSHPKGCLDEGSIPVYSFNVHQHLSLLICIWLCFILKTIKMSFVYKINYIIIQESGLSIFENTFNPIERKDCIQSWEKHCISL